MPIDTKVAGDIEGLRSAARWLREGLGATVMTSVDELYASRSGSEGVWTGQAGDGFRSRIGTGAAKADQLGVDAAGAGRSLDVYADNLATARIGMERARQVAAQGGLTVDGDVILEPGPAPPVPQPLPAGADAAQVRSYELAVDARNARAVQVMSYEAAAGEADRARQILRVAGDAGRAYWNELSGKPLLNTLDFTNGAVGGLAEQHKKVLLDEADRLRAHADLLRQDYLRSPGGSAQARAITEAEMAARNSADDLARRAGGLVRTIASKAPILGLAITATGIGYDIHTGKPPGKAIISGIAGGAASFGAGAAISSGLVLLGVSNPVGWAALGAVAVGVGVGLAADYAYDNWLPQDVRDGIENGAEAVGDWIGGAWDTVFG